MPSRSGSASGGAGRPGYPHVRAAGTWIMAKGLLPALSVEAANADELLAAATAPAGRRRGPREALPRRTGPGRQPVDRRTSSAASSTAVHARGARVTAHSGYAGRAPGRRRGRRGRPRARLRAGRGDGARSWPRTASASCRRCASWRRGGRSGGRRRSRASRRTRGARRSRPPGAGDRSRRASRTRPAWRSRPGRTSAAAPRARTSSPGRSSSSWRPAWSRGRPWRRRRGAAASSSASPTRA